MLTQCNQESLPFYPLARRDVRGRFDGGAISSAAGGLLLREVEKRTGIIAQFAACFRDHRDPARIEHTVEELVAQRVSGLALGYKDLNDHDPPWRAARTAAGYSRVHREDRAVCRSWQAGFGTGRVSSDLEHPPPRNHWRDSPITLIRPEEPLPSRALGEDDRDARRSGSSLLWN